MFKRIFKGVFLLVFLNVLNSRGFATENKIEQYNGILNHSNSVHGCLQNEVLNWIKKSANNETFYKDNIAAVRVNGKTYILCSSVINGKFHKSAVSPDDETYANFSPVVVIDLLYMYNAAHDYNQLVATTLDECLQNSRDNCQRKILENLIKLSIKAYSQNCPADVESNICDIIVKGDNDFGDDFLIENNNKENITQERLKKLKDVIVDFLLRLKRYGNDISYVAPDNIKNDSVVTRTNHLEDDKKKLTYFDLDSSTQQLKTPGAIEILLEKIDKNLTGNAPRDYKHEITSELISNLIKYILKMVSSPWISDPRDQSVIEALDSKRLPPINDISQTISAITHTEQVTDWIHNNFGKTILVKISGKAPCLKCSHYIQYGANVRDLWDQRTIIGFTPGWKRCEIERYRYPVKVFTISRHKVRKFQLSPEGILINSNTYDLSEFGEIMGINKSNCYAIEDVNTYTKRLKMNDEGEMIESDSDRLLEEPILVPSNWSDEIGARE